jgi:hypothetical protein
MQAVYEMGPNAFAKKLRTHRQSPWLTSKKPLKSTQTSFVSFMTLAKCIADLAQIDADLVTPLSPYDLRL